MASPNGVPTRDGELTNYSPDNYTTRAMIENRVMHEHPVSLSELPPLPSQINNHYMTARNAASGPGRRGLEFPEDRISLTRSQNEQIAIRGFRAGVERLRRLAAFVEEGLDRTTYYRASSIGNREILWVNGMNNSPEQHQFAARMLANLIQKPVVGVHNATGFDDSCMPDFGADLLQCALDYLIPLQMIPARLMRIPIEDLHGSDAEQLKYLWARNYVFAHNPASQALLEKLYDLVKARKRILIVCHSQGNLITMSVLWLLQWITERLRSGRVHIVDVSVYGLASPALDWPDGWRSLDLKLYSHTNDPVTWLSGWTENRPGVNRRVGANWFDQAEGFNPMRPHGAVSPDGYLNWPRFQQDIKRDLYR